MKKKHYKEGVDYTIHEYKRKKKRISTKAICPICSECKNRRICLNRKAKKQWTDVTNVKTAKMQKIVISFISITSTEQKF